MSDASIDPTMEEAMDFILRQQAAGIRVMLPARVEAYDNDNQTADVKPMLMEALESEEGVSTYDLPIISTVPVVFPRAGDYFLSFPLAKGHFVMLVFCDRSYDA